MRMRVQSPASLSGSGIQCCRDLQCRLQTQARILSIDQQLQLLFDPWPGNVPFFLLPRKKRGKAETSFFFDALYSFNRLPGCETPGKSINFLVPQFPHLQNADNNRMVSEQEMRWTQV